MGLLDLFGQQDDQPQQGLLGMLGNPVNRALLAAGASALENSGPSLRPVSTNQILGRMIGAGVNAYDSGVDLQQQQTLGGLKLRGLQQEQDQKQAMLDMQNRIRQRSTQAQDITGKPITPMQMAQMDGSSSQPAQQPFASAFPGGPMSPKIGGPDWMQAYQSSQPQPMTQPQGMPGASASANSPFPQVDTDSLNQRVAAHLARQAQIHIEEGDIDGGNKLYEQATKYLPEVNKIEAAQDPSGKPISVITFKDGTQRVSQFGPKPEIHFADDGQNTAIPINAYTGLAMGKGLKRQATPGELLNNQYQNANLNFQRSKEAAPDVDPVQVETLAQMVAKGQMKPPTGAALRSPLWGAVMARVGQSNPEYNDQDYGTTTKALKDFATGKQGNSVRSFNVLLSHLNTLGQLSDALGNGNAQAFNQLGNALARQTGGAAPTNFEAVKHIVGDEVVKAVTGGAGALGDREAIAKTINAANSPAQLRGVINSIKDLAVGQLGGLEQQYQTSTRRNDFSRFLSPEAQALYGKHTAQGAGPKVMTLSDIAATAKASGKTTAQVTAAARAAGFTIGGQ